MMAKLYQLVRFQLTRSVLRTELDRMARENIAARGIRVEFDCDGIIVAVPGFGPAKKLALKTAIRCWLSRRLKDIDWEPYLPVAESERDRLPVSVSIWVPVEDVPMVESLIGAQEDESSE